MYRLLRVAAAAFAAAALLTGALPVRAQNEQKMLIIANEDLFLIRTGDTVNGREMSVDERIGHVQDLYAKYLGGQYVKFTSKKFGSRVHIYMNGEFLLAVSPEDARLGGQKSADKLAPIWIKGLQRGFEESHTKNRG